MKLLGEFIMFSDVKTFFRNMFRMIRLRQQAISNGYHLTTVSQVGSDQYMIAITDLDDNYDDVEVYEDAPRFGSFAHLLRFAGIQRQEEVLQVTTRALVPNGMHYRMATMLEKSGVQPERCQLAGMDSYGTQYIAISY
jgi:hypothetical protein